MSGQELVLYFSVTFGLISDFLVFVLPFDFVHHYQTALDLKLRVGGKWPLIIFNGRLDRAKLFGVCVAIISPITHFACLNFRHAKCVIGEIIATYTSKIAPNFAR